MTLDASFRELEPYYSGGVSKNSLQGESSSENNGGGDEFIELENIQQESGGGDEFIELEKYPDSLSHTFAHIPSQLVGLYIYQYFHLV